MGIAVETWELTKRFGGFTAIDRITIRIEEGEICGIVGPNGAGKSTFIRMLCGILEPTSGNAKVLGFDLAKETEAIKSRLGYMSQKFSLYEDLSVWENLDFYAGLYGIPWRERRRRIEEVIGLAGLSGAESSLVGELSIGWRQRLALGCAIIGGPSILFLDEPTSGVSPAARREFFGIIKRMANEGITVLVTTHFMDEAERCSRVAFISGGQLLAYDTPAHLKASALDGHLVEVEADDPVEAIRRIEKLPFVKECSLHGRLIHVLLGESSSVPALERSAGAAVRSITPSLEDVFIALAKRQRGGRGGNG